MYEMIQNIWTYKNKINNKNYKQNLIYFKYDITMIIILKSLRNSKFILTRFKIA